MIADVEIVKAVNGWRVKLVLHGDTYLSHIILKKKDAELAANKLYLGFSELKRVTK